VTQTTLTMLIALSGLGLLLAAWALFAIRAQISRPLTAITEALSNLAMGRTDTEVPGVERQDEIGKMIQAFEVFRRNAWALQRAQAAAEAAQQKAQVLARADALTHLPNRRVLSEELQKAINEAERGSATYGVFLLDLDRFKPINDLHGHAVGDMVLTEIAARLKGLMPKGDTIARLGGDEFGAIVRSPDSSSGYLETLAASMIRAIGAPIIHGDKALDVGGTIGLSRCPADGTDTGTLLRNADIAMYSAKRNGRGTYRFFEPQMDKDLRERAELETDIRAAVAAKQIVPYYSRWSRSPTSACTDSRSWPAGSIRFAAAFRRRSSFRSSRRWA
jgi:diguanylate cyclase (GGDEF)-like protein